MRDGRPSQIVKAPRGVTSIHTGKASAKQYLTTTGLRRAHEHSARTKHGAGGYGTGATLPHRMQPTISFGPWSARGKIRRGYD